MTEEIADIDIVCFCGKTFTWERGERMFLEDLFAKGKIDAVTKPKRCKECRLKKKHQKKLLEERAQGY